jgi:phenylalanyl-tRNA synthetase alpha chain
MRGLGALPPEERPAAGARANEVKHALSALLDEREAELEGGRGAAAPVDLSLPGRARWRGARHPVTLVIDEICDVLAGSASRAPAARRRRRTGTTSRR